MICSSLTRVNFCVSTIKCVICSPLIGHFERPPYNESDIRSIYHVREYDVLKLMQIEEPIDIFISHDWPLGITEYGNWKKLLREKPFFKEEVILLWVDRYFSHRSLDMSSFFK